MCLFSNALWESGTHLSVIFHLSWHQIYLDNSWNLTRRVRLLTKESLLETMIIAKVTGNKHYFVTPVTCVQLIHYNNDTLHLGSTFHLNWRLRVNISILLVFHVNLCICHWQMKELQKCFPHHFSPGTQNKQRKPHVVSQRVGKKPVFFGSKNLVMADMMK